MLREDEAARLGEEDFAEVITFKIVWCSCGYFLGGGDFVSGGICLNVPDWGEKILPMCFFSLKKVPQKLEEEKFDKVVFLWFPTFQSGNFMFATQTYFWI